ncbi:MAG: hypothetical protein ACTSSG_03210 [Candidatus Heimdallarchaeaceae archaeon]
MSLFKTNFMKLVEAFLQDQGFTVEILLCIRARSGVASDPFVGDDLQIEAKLQEPALKLLSCVRSLNTGTDPVYCDKFKDMLAIPVIIMEKSSRAHPLYYYFDEETRESKLWYVKKNVVYLPWEWVKEFWNNDFEQSLKDQGMKVSPPIEYQPNPEVLKAIASIEEIIASKRIGILKSVYLNKPTLPPLVLTLTQTDQMLIFLVNEKDEDIHPKLMDFAVYYFGPKTSKFPTTVRAIFFNIITSNPEESFLQPYIPKDNAFVEKHFENPTVIKTTVEGFKNLLNIAEINELPSITKSSYIPRTEIDNLIRYSSGFIFSKVFQEAKKRIKTLYRSGCPFCSNKGTLTSIPEEIISKLNLNLAINKENYFQTFCNLRKGGCGWGFIIIKNEYQGGLHGFFIGGEQQYAHEMDNIKQKFREIGLEIHTLNRLPS